WPQAQELRNNGRTHFWSQYFGTLCALLWSEDTHPDLLRLRPCGPEFEEVFEVVRSIGDLAGDGAVDGGSRAFKIFQNAFVSCRLSARIVLRLKAVDRDNKI